MNHIRSITTALAASAMVAFLASPGAAEEKQKGAAHADHAGHADHATPGTMGAGAEVAGSKPAAYTGEVIDLTCFTVMPEAGSGPEHATCAKSCLEKGLPAGLLVGGKLYTAIMKDHTAPFKSLAPYAGEIVTVKGVTKESNGSWFLIIDEITPPAQPAKK